ncbi:MAG: DUF3305 domain-containing protein [Paracoccaceae bacterium]|nr:DUF3305 domain-containing protein [Paracoccaceae bacterium]
MPLGVVIRRQPGRTRWASWAWQAVAVLPHAGPANWDVISDSSDATEYHASSPLLELHGADTEAYLHGLTAAEPAIYVVLRQELDNDQRPLEVLLVTASPYEAQDYTDSGEELVEKVAMPSAVTGWIEAFVGIHHEHEAFIKRRRDKADIGQKQEGIGDTRIAQLVDVYRAPTLVRKARLN